MDQPRSFAPTDETLAVLVQVLRTVAATRGLAADDAHDFSQWVHVRMLETRYASLRQFRGHSSLRTYLTIVIERLLKDWQNHVWGKWRPSAEARRLGAVAMRFERLVHRDGFTVHEAAESLRHGDTTVSRADLEALAARLPRRVQRRMLPVDSLDGAAEPRSEDPLARMELTARERQREQLVSRALQSLPTEDRRLLAARFSAHGRLSAMARDTGADVKLLYRRCDRALQKLRVQVREAISNDRASEGTRLASRT